MKPHVVYARLPLELYLKLQLLAAEEAARCNKRVTLQGMVSLLIQRAAISTQLPQPSETETVAADEQQTSSSATSTPHRDSCIKGERWV